METPDRFSRWYSFPLTLCVKGNRMTLMERDFYTTWKWCYHSKGNQHIFACAWGGIREAKKADEQVWGQIMEVTDG